MFRKVLLKNMPSMGAGILRVGTRAGMMPKMATSPKIFRLSTGIRHYSDAMPPMDDYESKIYKILQEEFQPQALEVRDVSGGCGSMFAILVESEKFAGVPMIKQHRLVNEVLRDEIAKWHGLQLRTKAP